MVNVTIISRAGCPLCEAAEREFSSAGHDVAVLPSLAVLPAATRRVMLADLVEHGGDPAAYPQIFVDGKWVDWRPAGSASKCEKCEG